MIKSIKEPNASGRFYEADPKLLRQSIDKFFAKIPLVPYNHFVDIIIVPHAGYMYSGEVAAYAFKAVSENQYKTIILLGPTHYYRFDGVAVWSQGGFKTPLGVVAVDEDFIANLLEACPVISHQEKIFERDHVLEVEIPFLQKIFSDFKIVPLIMSRDNDMGTLKKVAHALNQVVADRKDVLIVISSDLSHFHEHKAAYEIDSRGLQAVVTKDIEKLWNGHQQGIMEIDGYKEIITALTYAQMRGLNRVELLKYADSGDITGELESVVGYASLAIYAD